MKNERIRDLEHELKYLTDSERKKEVELNASKLVDEKCNVKELAKEIYIKRGLDISKIKNSIFNNLIDSINEMTTLFKNKDKKVKNKMIIEIIYIVVLLLLIKIPFDLVRDIGYEYIELLSTNTVINTLWNLAFLLIYTVTIICSFIVFIRNFNKKYRNTNI